VEQDERLLVERAKSDAEAFGVLYDRYVDHIYRFAYARLGNVAGAEDVTAEVFVKALRDKPVPRPGSSVFLLALPDRP